MSIFSRLTKALASESGELKKIRMESEKRRTAKTESSSDDPEVLIDKTIEALNHRIDKSGRSEK